MPTLRGKREYTARNADKFRLYLDSVQAPETDAGYVDRLYKRLRGQRAHLLREDFCGTAAISCEWVKRHREHRAIGVDLDVPTLTWGIQNNLCELTPDQQRRMNLMTANVLDVSQPKVDILVAMNFSYFIFKKREDLLRYFQNTRRSLKPKGLFLLDAFGGAEAHAEIEESRRCRGFKYVWQHARFNPITNEILCHIHFQFKDGSRLRKAFTYDWRLWSLIEIQEVLEEAGFAHVEVHWEGTDTATGEGNGVYRRAKRGEAIDSWVAYIVALA